MAHGQPDWSMSFGVITTTTYQVSDVGELAARLGSIDCYDRRGDVLMIDRFDAGARRWILSTAGAGAAAYTDIAESSGGDFCMSLVAGSNGNHYAQADHYSALPALSALGLELLFVLNTATDTITLTAIVLTGALSLTFAVRIDVTNKLVQVSDSAGNFQTVSSVGDVSTQDDLAHHLKLVANPATQAYMRVVFDGNTYDVSAYTAQAAASAAAPLVNQRIRNTGRSGHNDPLHVTGFIYTHNEPD